MIIKPNKLVFTEKNIKHIARHEVIPEEVKEIIEDKPVFYKAKLERIMAVGFTKSNRMIAVILDKVGEEETTTS